MKTVIKRLVFYIQIQLESPLNVASGEEDVYKRQDSVR